MNRRSREVNFTAFSESSCNKTKETIPKFSSQREKMTHV